MASASLAPVELSVACPAKINLHLSVVGRRPDGFHELVSLVAHTDFADQLSLRWFPDAQGEDSLEVSGSDNLGPAADNLVLRAAAAFRRRIPGLRGRAVFSLEKRIPAGAGFGGGSSDAVGALRLLASIAPKMPAPEVLHAAAAEVGSDCPLFLQPGLVRMEGRGDRILPVPPHASSVLDGRRVFLFKPSFPVPTAWAYSALQLDHLGFDDPAHARARLDTWISGAADLPDLLYNRFTSAVGRKFLTLPLVLEQIRLRFHCLAEMSGSGSGCFAFPDHSTDFHAFQNFIHQCWGPHAFCVDARLVAEG